MLSNSEYGIGLVANNNDYVSNNCVSGYILRVFLTAIDVALNVLIKNQLGNICNIRYN